MSHLPLDARAILHYLNELGYRNISAEQLKEFLKDLRKLIKYEDRMGVNIGQPEYREQLFNRTTAQYRARVDKEKAKRLAEQEERQKPIKRTLRERNNGGATASEAESGTSSTNSPRRVRIMPIFAKEEVQKTQNARLDELERRIKAMSIGLKSVQSTDNTLASKENKEKSTNGKENKPSQTVKNVATENGFIREPKSALIPRSANHSKRRKPRANDPVALYQYYQAEWSHFRRQIPGEDPHTLLRWRVRSKLLNPEQ